MNRRLRQAWPIAVIGVLIVALPLTWMAIRARSRSRIDEHWERCKRAGVLRVGMDASYPPFEVDAGGEFQGLDVDLAREVGRRLGLQVTFVNVSFDGLYDALGAGRCDVLISALPYDPSRTVDVLYTGGYFNAGQVIVTRRDEEGIKTYADLARRRVAVEMGSVGHQEALRLRNRERMALTITAARSSEEAFDLLQAGKADAVIADRITARLALRARPELVIRGTPLTDDSFVIAVPGNSPQLYAAVRQALDGLRAEGWLEQLTDRWL